MPSPPMATVLVDDELARPAPGQAGLRASNDAVLAALVLVGVGKVDVAWPRAVTSVSYPLFVLFGEPRVE
jgi:hypothetical protein